MRACVCVCVRVCAGVCVCVTVCVSTPISFVYIDDKWLGYGGGGVCNSLYDSYYLLVTSGYKTKV